MRYSYQFLYMIALFSSYEPIKFGFHSSTAFFLSGVYCIQLLRRHKLLLSVLCKTYHDILRKSLEHFSLACFPCCCMACHFQIIYYWCVCIFLYIWAKMNMSTLLIDHFDVVFFFILTLHAKFHMLHLQQFLGPVQMSYTEKVCYFRGTVRFGTPDSAQISYSLKKTVQSM